jgi:hypothetical protein
MYECYFDSLGLFLSVWSLPDFVSVLWYCHALHCCTVFSVFTSKPVCTVATDKYFVSSSNIYVFTQRIDIISWCVPLSFITRWLAWAFLMTKVNSSGHKAPVDTCQTGVSLSGLYRMFNCNMNLLTELVSSRYQLSKHVVQNIFPN